MKAELEKTNNVEAAACLGKVIAEKAKEKGITAVSYTHLMSRNDQRNSKRKLS